MEAVLVAEPVRVGVPVVTPVAVLEKEGVPEPVEVVVPEEVTEGVTV
jgi:hypothetical protein